MNLEENIKLFNQKVSELKELAHLINQSQDIDQHLITTENYPNFLNTEDYLRKYRYKEVLHAMYDIIKESPIKLIEVSIDYENNDEGGSYKRVSYSFPEYDENEIDYEDYIEQLQDHIDGEVLEEDVIIDLTPIRAMHEQHLIEKSLDLQQTKKTKISKI